MTTSLTVDAHRHFINVEKNSGKMAQQKSCCQTKESDVQCSLLAADVDVDTGVGCCMGMWGVTVSVTVRVDVVGN